MSIFIIVTESGKSTLSRFEIRDDANKGPHHLPLSNGVTLWVMETDDPGKAISMVRNKQEEMLSLKSAST
jgi:hypothetical protein